MSRKQQAEYLKEQLAVLLNNDKTNPIMTVKIVDIDLFKEMAFCFIAKHGE